MPWSSSSVNVRWPGLITRRPSSPFTGAHALSARAAAQDAIAAADAAMATTGHRRVCACACVLSRWMARVHCKLEM